MDSTTARASDPLVTVLKLVAAIDPEVKCARRDFPRPSLLTTGEHALGARLFAKIRPLMILAIAIAMLFGVVASAQAKSRTSQRIELRSYAIRMTNNSLRYLHTSWFKKTYSYQTVQVVGAPDASGTPGATETVEMLAPKGGFSTGEVPIRSQASAIYATAIALHNGYYSASEVTVSKAEALRRTVAWTSALASSYQTDQWGHGWQSGLWVYYLGFGAKQVWSSLPESTRSAVASDVASEADSLLARTPPFYKDATGFVVYSGDSKSDENAWNASLLIMAAREFPDNPHAADWERQGRWYQITAYATPDQIWSDPRIIGSNVNMDGTIVNHRRIHPDYMVSQGEYMAKIELVANHTGSSTPTETANNFGRVWRALTRVKFSAKRFDKPGGTIYRRGPHWTTTASIYYPQGADWSYYRRFNDAEMDVEAFAARVDSMAYGWAKSHMRYVVYQQRQHKDGHIFSRGQTRFGEDEQFAAVSAAEMAYRLSVIR